MKCTVSLLLSMLALLNVACTKEREIRAEQLANGSVQVGSVEIHHICQYGLQFLLVDKNSYSPHLVQVMAPNGSPLLCQDSVVPETLQSPRR